MCDSRDSSSTLRRSAPRHGRRLRRTLLLVAVSLTALTRGPAARAETFDVPCDAAALSSAIATVNGNGEEDVVWLAPSCFYALPATWTIAHDGGNPVWVYGRGAVLSGANVRLPLIVSGGAIAHVEALTVRNGAGSQQGGGIRNLGTLTLTNSAVTRNVAAQGWGGGIYNGGVLRLHATAVSDNQAGAGGGGIDNDGTPRLTLVDSGIARNSAPYGAGLRNEHVAMLINSSLYGNVGPLGGALLNEGSGRASLSHVTVSGNGASGGGGSGVHNDGILALEASIVANTAAGNTDCWSGGTLTPVGANLIEDGSCGVPGALTGDPMLGAPVTRVAVLPLLAGSPALDAGALDRCPGTDQRGAPRPRDSDQDGTAGCDLGAYERQPKGACGLLGIEPFLLLPLLRRGARAARTRSSSRS